MQENSGKKNNENEEMCITSMFIKTPKEKGNDNYYHNSEKKQISVSPFFDKKQWWLL